MPRISAFHGILIYMYWNEGDHPIPHFHAHQAPFRASVDRQLGGGEAVRTPFFRSHRCLNMDAVAYLPAIVGVAVVRDHCLRLLFDNGTVGDVDLSQTVWTGVLEPLGDPAFFAQVRVDPQAATVVWPNGLDMASEPLYEQALQHPLVAA